MGVLIVAENKRARHDYEILETFEAGLVLQGSEVKSLRDRKLQLKDSFIEIQRGEAFLKNAHISEYKASSYNNHHPERPRKLLLHQSEIDKIFDKIRLRGFTIVPLKVYFKKGWAKVLIGVGKGKKRHDKRESLKRKEAQREMRIRNKY